MEYSQTTGTTAKNLGDISPCLIYNDGSVTVYWGTNAGVTTSSGHPIPTGSQA